MFKRIDSGQLKECLSGGGLLLSKLFSSIESIQDELLSFKRLKLRTCCEFSPTLLQQNADKNKGNVSQKYEKNSKAAAKSSQYISSDIVQDGPLECPDTESSLESTASSSSNVNYSRGARGSGSKKYVTKDTHEVTTAQLQASIQTHQVSRENARLSNKAKRGSGLEASLTNSSIKTLPKHTGFPKNKSTGCNAAEVFMPDGTLTPTFAAADIAIFGVSYQLPTETKKDRRGTAFVQSGICDLRGSFASVLIYGTAYEQYARNVLSKVHTTASLVGAGINLSQKVASSATVTFGASGPPRAGEFWALLNPRLLPIADDCLPHADSHRADQGVDLKHNKTAVGSIPDSKDTPRRCNRRRTLVVEYSDQIRRLGVVAGFSVCPAQKRSGSLCGWPLDMLFERGRYCEAHEGLNSVEAKLKQRRDLDLQSEGIFYVNDTPYKLAAVGSVDSNADDDAVTNKLIIPKPNSSGWQISCQTLDKLTLSTKSSAATSKSEIEKAAVPTAIEAQINMRTNYNAFAENLKLIQDSVPPQPYATEFQGSRLQGHQISSLEPQTSKMSGTNSTAASGAGSQFCAEVRHILELCEFSRSLRKAATPATVGCEDIPDTAVRNSIWDGIDKPAVKPDNEVVLALQNDNADGDIGVVSQGHDNGNSHHSEVAGVSNNNGDTMSVASLNVERAALAIGGRDQRQNRTLCTAAKNDSVDALAVATVSDRTVADDGDTDTVDKQMNGPVVNEWHCVSSEEGSHPKRKDTPTIAKIATALSGDSTNENIPPMALTSTDSEWEQEEVSGTVAHLPSVAEMIAKGIVPSEVSLSTNLIVATIATGVRSLTASALIVSGRPSDVNSDLASAAQQVHTTTDEGLLLTAAPTTKAFIETSTLAATTPRDSNTGTACESSDNRIVPFGSASSRNVTKAALSDNDKVIERILRKAKPFLGRYTSPEMEALIKALGEYESSCVNNDSLASLLYITQRRLKKDLAAMKAGSFNDGNSRTSTPILSAAEALVRPRDADTTVTHTRGCAPNKMPLSIPLIGRPLPLLRSTVRTTTTATAPSAGGFSKGAITNTEVGDDLSRCRTRDKWAGELGEMNAQRSSALVSFGSGSGRPIGQPLPPAVRPPIKKATLRPTAQSDVDKVLEKEKLLFPDEIPLQQCSISHTPSATSAVEAAVTVDSSLNPSAVPLAAHASVQPSLISIKSRSIKASGSPPHSCETELTGIAHTASAFPKSATNAKTDQRPQISRKRPAALPDLNQQDEQQTAKRRNDST